MSYHRRRREHKARLSWTIKRLRERRASIQFVLASQITVSAMAQMKEIRSTLAVTAEEKEYRQALHVTPKEECDYDSYRISLRRAKWLLGGSVVAGVIIAVFYAIPYQQAKNDGGPFRLLSAETLIVIAYMASFLIAGGLAYRGIKRSYGPKNDQPGGA